MEISQILSILAAAVLLVAYVDYFRHTSRGTATPNSASWSLWVVLIILNAVAYGIMTGDSVKAYLSAASSVAAIAVFLNALVRGKFQRLNKWDTAVFFLGLLAMFAWWKFNSAIYGHFILLLCLFISFIPTIRGVWENPRNEPPRPWLTWGGAFLILILVVLMRWRGQPQDLAYPILGFAAHTLGGFLALRKIPIIGRRYA